ncbi:MAG: patatin-like phospholipase family protein [Syntrophaceae bacterium]|nr:patatin-like phospholipase family protein [Syntrophaceae bacterium]
MKHSSDPKRRAAIVSRFLLVLLVCALSWSCAPKVIPPAATPARVAVVLGAGASKGFAHVGVLKVLEMNRIPVHMVVGTSVGSFVGSLYAYGYDAFTLQKMALMLERDEVVDLTLPSNGFVEGKKLENWVNRAVQNNPIERFRIPFHAVATNIQTGEEIVFGTGNAGMAVRASCSIPGIFKPARIAGQTYVDGGTVNPLAVDVARRYGADVVIAVDISGGVDRSVPESTMETILKSIDIMYNRIALAQTARADVLIRPNVAGIGSADFTKRHQAILEGERAAQAALPQIQAILVRLQAEGRLTLPGAAPPAK